MAPRSRHRPWIATALWLVLLAAAVAVLPVAADRWRLEAQSDHVELVADWDGVKELARRTGRPVETVLAGWRDAGVGSLALPPYRLADVGRHGEDYFLISGLELVRWRWMAGQEPDLGGLPLFPHHTYIVFSRNFQREPVLRDVRTRPWGAVSRGMTRPVWEAERSDGSLVMALPVSDPQRVHQAYLGLLPEGMARAAAVGLVPVPRWTNAIARGGEAVDELVARVGGRKPRLVIFSGTEALGYPYRLPEVAAALGREGMHVGWVEFAFQHGLPHLIQLMDGQAVRVHSISAAEMDRLTPDAAVRRWVRAVRERGIRVLYVRPFLRGAPPDELIGYNEAYVHELVRRLTEAGMVVGPSRPLGMWRGSPGLLLAAAVGVGAAAALVLGLWGVRHPLVMAAVAAAAPVFAAALYLKGYTALSRQAVAFAVTVVMPVLAVGQGLRAAGGGPATSDGRARPAPLALFKGFFVTVGVTAVGVVLLVAALADFRFLLGTEQYLGVKAAHVVPVLAVALMTFRWTRGGAGMLRAVFREPLRWGQLAAAVVLGGLFAVYVLRTGHTVLGVAQWELLLRNWLEDTLTVRPRTKELFLGYPALVVALAGAAGRGRSAGRWLLPAAAAIAPISVLNSFAHAHTALAVSALRTFWGMAVGGALGLVLLALLVRFARLLRPAVPAPSAGSAVPAPSAGSAASAASRAAGASASPLAATDTDEAGSVKL